MIPKAFGGNGGHPQYEANQSRARVGGYPACQTSCCIYCGKAAPKSAYAVFLNCLGEPSDPKAPENQFDCLGYYPIGSDCKKLFRDAGIKVWTWKDGDWR